MSLQFGNMFISVPNANARKLSTSVPQDLASQVKSKGGRTYVDLSDPQIQSGIPNQIISALTTGQGLVNFDIQVGDSFDTRKISGYAPETFAIGFDRTDFDAIKQIVKKFDLGAELKLNVANKWWYQAPGAKWEQGKAALEALEKAGLTPVLIETSVEDYGSGR